MEQTKLESIGKVSESEQKRIETALKSNEKMLDQYKQIWA
jgi:hypothetical protein